MPFGAQGRPLLEDPTVKFDSSLAEKTSDTRSHQKEAIDN